MEIENTESQDVSNSEGQVSPDSSESSTETQQPAADASASSSHEEKLPFHEHPRWKEVISQKNEYAQRVQEYENQVRQLQMQLQQFEQQKPKQQPQSANDPRSKLFGELKQIRPEFGELVEELYTKLNSIEQSRQQDAMERELTMARSTLDNLYSEHKLSDKDKELYESMIGNRVFLLESQSGKALRAQDLPAIFKEVHDSFSSYKKELERSVRESYVTDKKKDQVPATTTGGKPAITAKDKPSITSRDELKAQIAQKIKESRNLV